MTPLSFTWAHVGQHITSVGGIGGECVDLANEWLAEAYGLPHIYRNAIDWRGVAIAGHTWVENTPTNYPSIGSIVVWGPNARWGIGPFGHIALCLSADAAHLVSFDQNWPTGAAASLHLHDYEGVLGWHQPK